MRKSTTYQSNEAFAVNAPDQSASCALKLPYTSRYADCFGRAITWSELSFASKIARAASGRRTIWTVQRSVNQNMWGRTGHQLNSQTMEEVANGLAQIQRTSQRPAGRCHY